MSLRAVAGGGGVGLTTAQNTKLASALYLKADFGAVGDDTHDDTDNIRAWLAASTSDRGPELVMEPGVYKITDAITNLKTGQIIRGMGHFGMGPSSDSADCGAIIRQHTAGKYCWIQGDPAGVNVFKGSHFKNIGFHDATGTGSGGLALYTGFNTVEACSAGFFLTGNGFLTAIPSGGDSAPLNIFRRCLTNDCLHGWRDLAGYVTWEHCVSQKFSLGGGGVPHTGTGIWSSRDQSTVAFGHHEGSDNGILNDSTQGIRIAFTTFEDNNTLDIWMNRATGSNGTRSLLCVTTSKVRFGAHQVGDVQLGGDFNSIVDEGDTTILIGHEVIKIGSRSL